MHVDTPLDGSIVSGALTVAGWALDPDATRGSGIDTIHVWAFRRDVAAAAPWKKGYGPFSGMQHPQMAFFASQHG